MNTSFIFSLFMAAFCTSSSLFAIDQALMHSYTAPGGFTISFPKKWTIRPELDHTEVTARAEKTDKNLFLQNASVIAAQLERMSLDDYFAASMKKVESSVTHVKLEDTGYAKVDHREAKWAIYQVTVQGVSGKVIQYMIRNGNQVLIFTGTASAEQFATDRSMLEAIATSIQFEKSGTIPQHDLSPGKLQRNKQPMQKNKIPTATLLQRAQSVQPIPGDADMPARLYYNRSSD